jgi:hypothetical protein
MTLQESLREVTAAEHRAENASMTRDYLGWLAQQEPIHKQQEES